MNKNTIFYQVACLCFLLSQVACTKRPPPDGPTPPPILGNYVFVGQSHFKYVHHYTDDSGKVQLDVIDSIYTDTVDVNAGPEEITFFFRPGTLTNSEYMNFGGWFPMGNSLIYAYYRPYTRKFDLSQKDYLLGTYDKVTQGGGFTSTELDFNGKKLE